MYVSVIFCLVFSHVPQSHSARCSPPWYAPVLLSTSVTLISSSRSSSRASRPPQVKFSPLSWHFLSSASELQSSRCPRLTRLSSRLSTVVRLSFSRLLRSKQKLSKKNHSPVSRNLESTHSGALSGPLVASFAHARPVASVSQVIALASQVVLVPLAHALMLNAVIPNPPLQQISPIIPV